MLNFSVVYFISWFFSIFVKGQHFKDVLRPLKDSDSVEGSALSNGQHGEFENVQVYNPIDLHWRETKEDFALRSNGLNIYPELPKVVEVIVTVVNPAQEPEPPEPEPEPDKSIIIGLGVGFGMLAILLLNCIVIIYFISRRLKERKHEDKRKNILLDENFPAEHNDIDIMKSKEKIEKNNSKCNDYETNISEKENNQDKILRYGVI